MFSRAPVGQVKHFVPSTKRSEEAWAKSTLNIFSAEAEAEKVLAERRPSQYEANSNVAVAQDAKKLPPGGVSQVKNLLAFAEEPATENAVRSSTKVVAAPGGNAVGNLLRFDEQPAVEASKPSTKVISAPGGRTNINVFSSEPEVMPAPARTCVAIRPVQASQIFEPEQPKSSTRRLAAPGGNDSMGSILSHNCAPEVVKSVRTAQANESQHICNLTPERAPAGLRTGRTNVSQHVVNLTPAPVARTTSRTSRVNDESAPAQAPMPPPPAERFQARNKMLHEANVFAAQQEQQEQQPEQASLHGTGRSSTKRIHAPGGASSNIISWN